MTQDVRRPGWWQRNWKWAVPVGSVMLLGLFAAMLFAMLSFVFGMMRSSMPYQHAVSVARASPEVTAALGEPIEAGFFVSGNINIDNDSGEADLSIPLQGPKGEAMLYVEAERERRRWSYQTLLVALPDRDIDLLEGDEEEPAGDEYPIENDAEEDTAPEAVDDEAEGDY